MENIVNRSMLDNIVDKIDASRFANSLNSFIDDLEGPTRQSLNKLVDSGIDALRSRLGLRTRRSALGRSLLITAAVGALGWLAYQGYKTQHSSPETIH